jgi:rhodanese-related sulfurtransferase
MPRFLLVLLLSFGLCAVGAHLEAQEVRGPDLTKYEVLADALKRKLIPNLVIVDVRAAEFYNAGHIPGAINIPLEKIYSEFPSNSAVTPILVYGRPASADSRKAVDILTVRGYKNVILFGSINQWQGDLQ